jgi:DNA end-binding protein Ku
MSDLIAALEASVAKARGGRKPAAPTQRGKTSGKSEKKPRKAEPNGAAPDLSELSKADLTAMARDLDVPGRSSMNRAELEKAVAKASGAAPGKRKAS